MAESMHSAAVLKPVLEGLRAWPEQKFIFHVKGVQRSLTFAEMNELVAVLAQSFREAGVSAACVCGIMAANGVEAVAIDLALLTIGCMSVHIPESTGTELLRTLDVMTHVARAALVGDFVSGETWVQRQHVSGVELWARAAPRDTPMVPGAAIIFSSGTTGRTKKLLVSGAGVLHNAQAFLDLFAVDTKDTFLLFLPFSNYQQRLLMYGCLLCGANVAVSDVATAPAALRSVKPTLFLAPPLFYESAEKVARVGKSSFDEEAGARLNLAFGGCMRLMWSGMAPIAEEVLARYSAARLPLLEAYGMTEIGPICSNRPGDSKRGSVGRPIMRGSVRLADDGEVIVYSRQPLTLGYHDDDSAENANVYLDQCTIATGDLARFDADGFLFLNGRKKELILTSSGHKVHPHDIERAFVDLPFVTNAVLMGTGRADLGMLFMVSELTPEASERIASRLKDVNANQSRAFPIRHWFVAKGQLTAEDGLLTRNMKLNRPAIARQFEALVFGAKSSGA